MKYRNIIAAGVAASAGLAAQSVLAQGSVSIYGIVDTGVAYITNANAAGNSVLKMPSLTGELPSRIGFRGTEDIGGGLSAIFVLESGISIDTGAMGQGNRLFGRQSFVGLKGGWGQLMLGRQLNMSYFSTQKSDVLGPNIISISSLDSYLPNARSDNAIGYMGSFSDVTVGATYSFGRDSSSAGGPAATSCAGEVAGNSKACRQLTALLGYDNNSYGASISYDIMYGNTGAAGGLTSSDNTDQRVILSGYYMLAQLKLAGGVIDRRTRAAAQVNVDSDLWYFGATYPLSVALVLDGQLSRLNIKNSANKTTLAAARLTYNLSKRTALYSSLGYIRNHGVAAVAIDAGGTVGVGKNQFGTMVGVKHMF